MLIGEVRGTMHLVVKKPQAQSQPSGGMKIALIFCVRKSRAKTQLSYGMAKFQIALEGDLELLLRKSLAECQFQMRAFFGFDDINRVRDASETPKLASNPTLYRGPAA